jgi:hypothetical protein
MNYRIPIRLLVPLITIAALAQQQRDGEPIDFMTIVIEGKESLHLPKSLVKQPPQLPPPYHRNELDSINPLEKVPLFRSEPLEYPRQIVARDSTVAALTASAGLYGFATLSGQYATHLDRYTFDLDGLLDRGGAYLPNADYFRTRFRIVARTVHDALQTVQPTSGSGAFDVETRTYSLFALPMAPERSSRTIRFNLTQNAAISTAPMEAALNIGTTRLQYSDSGRTDESELGGRFTLDPLRIGSVQLGFSADASFRNYRATPIHFHTLAARGIYGDSALALTAQLGGQLATTSRRTTEFAPLLHFRTEWRTTDAMTLDAELTSGMEPVRFGDMLSACPYITDTAAIAVRTIGYRIATNATYTPTTRLRITLGLGIASLTSAPYWESLIASATFAPIYRAQSERNVHIRGWYQYTPFDIFTAEITYNDVQLDNGRRAPYQPLLRASIEYGRILTERFTVSARIGYVSSRRTSALTDEEIPAYLALAGRAEYRLNDVIGLTATVDNLASSTIELWRGYRERGSFVAIGAVVRF